MSLELLGLPATASTADVRRRYKHMASERHPDRQGGDTAAFQELQVWYQDALEEASQPLSCQHCQGRGWATITQGFASIKMPCYHCNGQGSFERGLT